MPEDNEIKDNPNQNQDYNSMSDFKPLQPSVDSSIDNPRPSQEPRAIVNTSPSQPPEVPATYSELESTQRVSAPVSPPPAKKSRKKITLVAVVAGVLALLGAGTALGYNLWYQNPDKVIGDAIQNAITAESVNFDGTIRVSEDGNKFISSFDGALVGSKAKVSGDMKYDFEGDSYEIGASAVLDKDATLFFKLSNIEDVLGVILEGEDVSFYEPVIDKIEDQWIRLDQDDKSVAEEQVCMANVFSRVSKDGSASDDLKRLYLENRMIEVKKDLVSKSINDVDSIGYEIEINSKAVESFFKGLDDTQLARDLRECDDDFSFKIDEVTDNKESLEDTKIDIYVSRWSHELTQVIVSGKDGNETHDLVINPAFNGPVSIDAPSESKAIEEIMSAIQEAFISNFDFEEA